MKVTLSRLTLFDPMDYIYSPWNSLGQNTGVGGHSLLQGIFPTQGSNPGPPHCGRILYQLSHQGSPRIIIIPIVIRKNNTEFKEKGLMFVT